MKAILQNTLQTKRNYLFFIVFSFFIVGQAQASGVRDFISGVSYSIFKTGWPTAKYDGYEIDDIDSYSWGYYVVVKFKGYSSMCMLGEYGCPLWFKLRIKLNNSFSVKDMDVVSHNALLAPPFATSGALAQAIAEANGY